MCVHLDHNLSSVDLLFLLESLSLRCNPTLDILANYLFRTVSMEHVRLRVVFEVKHSFCIIATLQESVWKPAVRVH